MERDFLPGQSWEPWLIDLTSGYTFDWGVTAMAKREFPGDLIYEVGETKNLDCEPSAEINKGTPAGEHDLSVHCTVVEDGKDASAEARIYFLFGSEEVVLTDWSTVEWNEEDMKKLRDELGSSGDGDSSGGDAAPPQSGGGGEGLASTGAPALIGAGAAGAVALAGAAAALLRRRG